MKLRKKKHTSEDLTKKQVEDNYWHTTPVSKLDGSTIMMETRISKCQEATGKSREECANEVKTRMKDAGSENTNTEDLKDAKEEITEDTKDTKEKKEETTVDICPKELDMLREKAKKFDEMKEDFEDSKKDMADKVKDLIEYVDGLKAKESDKLEKKVEKKIKKYSEDFLIPEEKIKEKIGEEKGEKALKIIADFQEMNELAGIKAQTEDKKEVEGYDVETFTTDFEKKSEEILATLRHT